MENKKLSIGHLKAERRANHVLALYQKQNGGWHLQWTRISKVIMPKYKQPELEINLESGVA